MTVRPRPAAGPRIAPSCTGCSSRARASARSASPGPCSTGGRRSSACCSRGPARRRTGRIAQLYPEARARHPARRSGRRRLDRPLPRGRGHRHPLDVADLAVLRAVPAGGAARRARHPARQGQHVRPARRPRRPAGRRARRGTRSRPTRSPSSCPATAPCARTARPAATRAAKAMKRALLAMEGVRFDDAGRVAVARFHYGRGAGLAARRRARENDGHGQRLVCARADPLRRHGHRHRQRHRLHRQADQLPLPLGGHRLLGRRDALRLVRRDLLQGRRRPDAALRRLLGALGQRRPRSSAACC